MHTLMSYFIGGVPQAAAIWFALVLAAAAVFWLVARPTRRPAPSPAEPGEQARVKLRLRAHVNDLSRYAEEVQVAAERATAMADQFRRRWLAQQEAVESAWQRAERAATAERRLAAAALLPTPEPTEDPDEAADRERFLRRAVMSACARNELPLFELSEALAHRNGWDPARHPVEQELAVQRAVREAREAEHAAALERERAMWTEAQTALVHARSLRGEAAIAAMRCGRYRVGLPPTVRRSRSGARGHATRRAIGLVNRGVLAIGSRLIG